MTNNARQI